MTAADASPGSPTLPDTAAWPWLSAAAQASDAAETIGEFRHAFRIGPRWLLIPAGLPAEVYPPLPCARLPFTHGWCLGLASFRGDLAPVYDLDALMSERGAEIGRYFLLLGRRDACAALCIEEITGITVAPDTHSDPLASLPRLPADLACRGLVVDGTNFIEVDLGVLLGILAERASLIEAGTITSKDYP